MPFKFLLIFLSILLSSGLRSQTPTTDPAKPLIIGTKESAPFAMKGENGEWQGLSFDLWQQIALEMGVHYEVREMALDELFAALQRGEIDIAAAALSVTAEREEIVDFSHPYYITGLGIAVAQTSTGWMKIVLGLFSPAFLRVVGGLVLLLMLVGLLIWLFERRKNPEQFGGRPVDGIFSGFWWSAVTMTTVGYGDKAPRSAGGKVLAIVWMFAAIIMISGITAALTTSLTVGQLQTAISGPDDLWSARVGTLAGTTAADLMQQRAREHQTFPTLQAGFRALASHEIDAFVHDAPILQHAVKSQKLGRIRVLPKTFERQYYGFALQLYSPYRQDLNRALLTAIDSDLWESQLDRYLGDRQ